MVRANLHDIVIHHVLPSSANMSELAVKRFVYRDLDRVSSSFFQARVEVVVLVVRITVFVELVVLDKNTNSFI